jgi:hypothetical protein
MNRLRCLGVIALVEWKLQVRTAVFWAGVAILLLYTLGQVIGAPPEMAFLTRQWLGGREDSLTWIAIVLIFLVPSALGRDLRPAGFLWTTHVSGGVYAAGKLLGVWLTALTLAVIELTGQLLVRMAAWNQLEPELAGLIVAPLGNWLVGIIFVTSLYFLLVALVHGHPLGSYALGALYFVIAFSLKDVANPFSFVPSALFRSDLVGDGPESPLFSAHVQLYLGLSMAVSVCAILTYCMRDRRLLFPRTAQAVLVISLILSLGPMGWAGAAFLQARDQVLALPSVSAHNPAHLSTEVVRSVHVTAGLDPERGNVHGKVELALAPTSEPVDFFVPIGLDLEAASDCQGHGLLITPLSADQVRVTAARQVCVEFVGSWRPSRSSYRTVGIDGPQEFDLNAPAYVGQGFAYLTPMAHWYPAPRGSYEWASPHEIVLTVPSTYVTYVSPAGSGSQKPGEVSFRWKTERGRPLIVLVTGEYQAVTLPNGDQAWSAPEHQHVAQSAAEFYLSALKSIDGLVGRTISAYQVVETPVLRWPVASGRLVLLPERFFLERLSTARPTEYERNVASLGPQLALQREIYYTARGWLQGNLSFADVNLAGGDTKEQGRALDWQVGDPPLLDCLAHYLSLQMADMAFASHRLDEVMTARMQFSEAYSSDPTLMHRGGGLEGELPVPPYDRSWEFNQMFTAIGRIERRAGRATVNQIVGLLVDRHAGTTITLEDWLALVSQVAGPEAAREFESTYPVQQSQLP